MRCKHMARPVHHWTQCRRSHFSVFNFSFSCSCFCHLVVSFSSLLNISRRIKWFKSRPLLFQVTTLGKLFAHVLLSTRSIIWYRSRASPLCGWEGNRRSAVGLRRRLQWFIHLRTYGLKKGEEYLAYTSHGLWHTLPLCI